MVEGPIVVVGVVFVVLISFNSLKAGFNSPYVKPWLDVSEESYRA